MSKRKTSASAWTAGAAAVAVAIATAVYFARTAKAPVSQLPSKAAATGPSSTAPTPVAPAVEHPIEQAAAGDAGTSAEPLPALDESDMPVFGALNALLGDGLAGLVNPQHLIQRIVATVDSLPRQKLAMDALPVRGAQGTFAAVASGDARTIDPRNAARYDAYARIAKAIDAKALVAWYVRFYPLFQQAYRELGYPDGYFNDRLIVVVDHLLATPDVAEPVALKQPNVMYEYADPALESRSAGQKLLMRSGPENEAAIKAKLREIRAALTNS